MSNLPIYVIANGELAKAALDAVAIVFTTETFRTALKISILFAIIGTAVSYIYGKNLASLAKWFIIYFILTTIMLGAKVTVQIIDSSNPGKANLTVANVPYGLGYPASIITSAAHGLVSVFEEAFHMPDDVEYNKTGMLFGSKLFRLSSEFHVINPVVKAELNEYIKNCVLGDMLISKKYTMPELTGSSNLLDTITKNTSNIRGIYIGGVFKTCTAAGAILKVDITKDINDNGFKIFGKRIFGNENEVDPAKKLQEAVTSTYGFFRYGTLSNSALEIITQNLMINGMREGLMNYTAETGATAALLNLSTTQAMERMRMSLATSRNIAVYTIPIIHTVLLLLMLSLFPIVILLAFQPSFTVQVLKNYFYTLIWIESWPLMFACLNLVVTYYAKSEIGPVGLTLDNIDQLVLQHSDIANMAGYLMMAIPFISGGLVMGMASAFNHAASYIGGVLQSSASSAASEAASGNISVGNSSWNNVNANKFDTNSTLMRGMSTEQLESGVLRTTRPDNETTYDSSHALSKLPTNVRASEMLSESFSNQAEAASSAAIQDQKSYDQSISHAVTDLNSFGKSLGSSKNTGENFTSREAASAAQSASSMQNIAKTIADRNHVDANDVFRGLTNFSQRLSGEASAKTPSINVLGAGATASLATEHLRSHESSTQHSVGRSIDVTAEEAKRFSNDMHKVEEYSKITHADTNQSEAASHLSQLSTDLRQARSASEQHSVHKAESERLSSSASFVRQHSGQIDSDLNQEIANYAVNQVGREGAEKMFAGKNRPGLEAIARDYIHNSGVESTILSNYQQNSSGISPDQKYHLEGANVEAKTSGIMVGHENQRQKNASAVKAQEVGIDQQGFSSIKDGAKNNLDEISDKMKNANKAQNNKYSAIQVESTKNIKDGAEKANSTAYNIGYSAKPDFLNPDKNKKRGRK
jgi:conjugal transfer mating pair stabilization protein TraG